MIISHMCRPRDPLTREQPRPQLSTSDRTRTKVIAQAGLKSTNISHARLNISKYRRDRRVLVSAEGSSSDVSEACIHGETIAINHWRLFPQAVPRSRINISLFFRIPPSESQSVISFKYPPGTGPVVHLPFSFSATVSATSEIHRIPQPKSSFLQVGSRVREIQYTTKRPRGTIVGTSFFNCVQETHLPSDKEL